MTELFAAPSETNSALKSLDLAAGRRAFVKALGFGAVGAAVFASAEGTLTPAMAQGVTDADILNFALNLEYLESAFYHFAYHGTDIPASNTTGGAGQPPGQLTGGKKVRFGSGLVRAYALEIATEELKHVEVLRAVLGPAAVSRPAINIGSAFAVAAKAAGIRDGAHFDAYEDDFSFLLASYIFEDVGVTAYHGAAGLISNKTYLNYAAGILAVEAYHAGIIRTSLFASGREAAVNDTALISNLRSTLANGKAGVDDIGIGTPSAPTLVPVDAPDATMFVDLPGGDAIAYARTTTQVLNIVYGNTGTQPGLFFPAGMNGTIR